MRLKQLDIKGFKSFANDTVVNFSEDVIGVVGPNGSGKSNIVDAIRWVLGEQKSKELRLDQMSSVIFNGTKKKRASGMAEVSLTFENTKNLLPTEYHTVTISRVLYRSGESEYRLNNVACRLKDITSLFMDTGIGSNSYAIIALGMVDDILADKNNARRKMFEQAAGISKYKKRKHETLNKLKSTTEDLERIEDLLFEIENNLKSLEKQAKRTKKYFELKATYKELSQTLAKIKVEHLKVRQNKIKTTIQQTEDSIRGEQAQIRQLEAKLEAVKKSNLEQEKHLSDRQRDLNRLVGSIRAMESDKRMLEQRVEFSTQNQGKLVKDIQQAKEKISQLKEDIEYYQENLQYEKRVEADLEDKLDAAEAQKLAIQAKHGNLKSDLDSSLKEQQQIERLIFELEKEKAINLNQIENFQAEINRNADDLETRRAATTELRRQLEGLTAQIDEVQTELERLQTQEAQRNTQLQATQKRLDELNSKIAKNNRARDAKRNEYKLTKSMVESLEGFPESIRFLSNHKDWKKQATLLSDLIYVKEEYRVAIEHYLESYLNYYVVENLQVAQEAIQLLSKSQKGKANFFLLDAFVDYTPPLSMLSGDKPAIELIQTDPKYYNLCSYLLEQVVVTDREDIGQAITDEGLVILSKTGRFIHQKHSLSGGSVGLFEGKKIGRKKNLELLEKDIKQLEAEENSLSSSFYTVKKQLEDLKQKQYSQAIQQQQKRLNTLLQQQVSLQTKLENFESFIQSVDDKSSSISQQITTLTTKNQTIDKELQSKQTLANTTRESLSSADETFKAIAEQLSQASAAFNEQNITFIRQQNKVETFQRELSFREKQLAELQIQLQQNERSLANADTDLASIQANIKQLDTTLIEKYEDKKVSGAGLSEVEQAFFRAKNEINEIEDSIRKSNRKQSDVQVQLANLKEQQNEVKFEVNAVAQRLQIEFNIDINAVINDGEEVDMQQNTEELERKVGKLKNKLDNYGEINPMAVEAYDEMKERYDTITTQRDDILEAKNDLMETIKEIEETATEQFLTSFDKARLYFIEVFRSLFSEDDDCDLILVEPDNPLESNIEIVAKPKGKRPQTISQLSGGEKTLTATALLFALYLLKPAPFCIFDEVDAPLDDANIEKFNRIIKKFSKESQFIIVTHNKLTMSAVDTIYGVYMQDGVSAVTPVDFRTFKETGNFESTLN